MDDQDQTSDLIQRYLHAACSEAELAALEDLLIHYPRAAEALADALRLDAGLTRIFRAEGRAAEVLANVTARQPLPAPSHSIPARPRRLAWRIAIAASLLVVAIPLVLLITGRRVVPPSNNELIQIVSGDVLVDGERTRELRDGATIRVVGDRPAVLRLPEGLEAELAPESSARLHSPAGLSQAVELNQGSGTFRAARTTQGGFQVETQLGCVTALGAQFSVQLQPPNPPGDMTIKMRNMAAMVVVVLTGVVQVDVDGQSYVLGGGESRVFAQEQHQPEASQRRNTTAPPPGTRRGLAANTVRGPILSVSQAKVTLGNRIRQTEFELNAGALLTIDGKPAALEQFRKGMIVSLERRDGQGPVISMNAEGPTIGGSLTSIDDEKETITITTAGDVDREQTYALAGDVLITLDGRPARLSDLHPGTSIALKLSVDNKTVIAINRARWRGEGSKGSRRDP